MVEGSVESGIIEANARNAVESAKQIGGRLEMLLPLRIASGLDGIEPTACGAAAVLWF